MIGFLQTLYRNERKDTPYSDRKLKRLLLETGFLPDLT
jgi:hypothetical protein